MLLEQLRIMEEEQLRVQEDMKEKQSSLKNAIAVGDSGSFHMKIEKLR